MAVRTLDDTSFWEEVLAARTPVVVDFYADWWRAQCGANRFAVVVAGSLALAETIRRLA